MQIFFDAIQLFDMMIKMDENKFEPLAGIEHAETWMFDALMGGGIMNEYEDIADPFPALHNQVSRLLFVDFLRRVLLRHHRRHLKPNRDGI